MSRQNQLNQYYIQGGQHCKNSACRPDVKADRYLAERIVCTGNKARLWHRSERNTREYSGKSNRYTCLHSTFENRRVMIEWVYVCSSFTLWVLLMRMPDPRRWWSDIVLISLWDLLLGWFENNTCRLSSGIFGIANTDWSQSRVIARSDKEPHHALD